MKVDVTDAVKLLTEKLGTWYEILVKNIPNFILAAVVFILFLFLAKLIKKILRNVLPKVTSNKSVISLFLSLSYITVILFGLFITLEILNLEKTVTSILAGAGVLGLALGFAFQEIASNFVSGIMIAFRQPYQVTDIIEIDGYLGEVKRIQLRTTTIKTFNGLDVLIPNKYLFTKPFTNYTTTNQRRIVLDVGVSYSDNLRKVEELTKEAISGIEGLVEEKPVEVFFNEFGGSSINFEVHIWIYYPENKAYLKVRHEAIMRIKENFDENNITIPFPIRTLEFGQNETKLMENVFNKK